MFREVVSCDFEFRIEAGGLPHVTCAVFRFLHSEQELRLDRHQLLAMVGPPFDVERDLFISYYAPAEIGCFLQLGWPTPKNIVDLYVEHRASTNGRIPRRARNRNSQSGKSGRGANSLLSALAIRGLGHLDCDEKDEMRNLILRSSDPSPEDMTRILEYCASDTAGAEALYRYMVDHNEINEPRALWRGRYGAAAARIERTGIPIDVDLHSRLSACWNELKHAMIADVNKDFGVFDEYDTFKRDRFAAYIQERQIPWPKLPSGTIKLDDKTFESMTRHHPILRPLYELRSSLGEMRLTGLAVGPDARNRCLLGIFQSATGRNQPSNTQFIFGPSRWIRGLIKPNTGYALAYIDWKSQEIAIAAALSSDDRLLEAYQSADVYLAFARQAGLAPAHATKKTHADVRNVCKRLMLGIGYGMSAHGIAQAAGISEGEATHLLRLHRQTYGRFWTWVDNTVATALFRRQISTNLGWRRYLDEDANMRSLQNFPMQAHGAEMMRAAAIAATECGLGICAPVHDAFLLEAPIEKLNNDVAAMREIMREAGRAVIGVPVETDVKIVSAPDRYMDEEGAEMWARVMKLLESVGTS